jgi:hypothetical protein
MADEFKVEDPLSSPPKHFHRYLALLLILVGLLLLARHRFPLSDVLWSIWWSLALIGLGLDLLTGGQQRSKIITGSLLAAFVLSILVTLASPASSRQELTDVVPPHARLSITDEEHIHAEVRVTAGNLIIQPLPGRIEDVARLEDDSGNLAYYREGQTGILKINPPRWSAGNVELALTRHVPLSLELHVDAGNADPLDLTELQLEKLDLWVRAGNAEIMLPAHGVMDVMVDSFAGNVQIKVPDELAARIEVDHVGQLNIGSRFRQQGAAHVFVSDDYIPDAPNRLFMRVTARGGNVEIH